MAAGELARRVGARVLLKAENLQLTGSFKARGATNTIRGSRADALAAAWWRPAPATTPRPWPSPRVTPAPAPCW